MRASRFRRTALSLVLVASLSGVDTAAADDLAAAVKEKDVGHVLALLKAGADPNRRLRYGAPINVAAALGPLEIVIALLDARADPQTPGFGGASPLHAAVLSGQSDVVRVLVARGAKVDALDNMGRTPLLTYASSAKHDLDVLRDLLKAGADPNDAEQATGIFTLGFVVHRGHVDEAEMLVAAGANVNAKDKLYGKTALHYATDCCDGGFGGANGSHEMVQFLLANGADVNAKDMSGYTPLDNVKRCAPNGGLLLDILSKAGAH